MCMFIRVCVCVRERASVSLRVSTRKYLRLDLLSHCLSQHNQQVTRKPPSFTLLAPLAVAASLPLTHAVAISLSLSLSYSPVRDNGICAARLCRGSRACDLRTALSAAQLTCDGERRRRHEARAAGQTVSPVPLTRLLRSSLDPPDSLSAVCLTDRSFLASLVSGAMLPRTLCSAPHPDTPTTGVSSTCASFCSFYRTPESPWKTF